MIGFLFDLVVIVLGGSILLSLIFGALWLLGRFWKFFAWLTGLAAAGVVSVVAGPRAVLAIAMAAFAVITLAYFIGWVVWRCIVRPLAPSVLRAWRWFFAASPTDAQWDEHVRALGYGRTIDGEVIRREEPEP